MASGRIAPAKVLLLNQHGSDQATSAEWLHAIAPQVVVILVGAGNAEGLPSPEVLDRLRDYNVLRMDVNGYVQAATDGRRCGGDGAIGAKPSRSAFGLKWWLAREGFAPTLGKFQIENGRERAKKFDAKLRV